jgi:hypothetical protein
VYNQEEIQEQIKNRCTRITMLIEKNAPQIILQNELKSLTETLEKYKPAPTVEMTEEEMESLSSAVFEAIISKRQVNKQ